ncbi:TonB-dependent receptor domain-containing protein [Thalassotalea profundi]|uniref:Ferric enterobactin uptake receptor n=1 Tax=Thalassotalea profundi TaxID=2036687 RepID=A0ABQ3IEK3_9GAMM|nr:TonB-dependent receptor [Thalassotalea profundi]GHE80723.1 ferric enterobactin uptake receptor [Thalassotalea profundi]
MGKLFKHSALATCITMACISNLNAAEVNSGPDASGEYIERIVVSATGFEQKLTDAPASISIITEEDIQSRPFTTLLDAIKYQEGVDIGTSRDKTGQGSISMRGLTSEYTLILVDGKRQNNHGDIYPNNFGGNAFGHIPPLDAIERVEVIRGPASTLYGADALGGAINIITKKSQGKWSGSVSFGRSLQSDDQFGDDITTDFSVMGPLIKGVLDLSLRGSVYERLASSPEFEPATDPNGELHYRSLGFGRGGKTVDNTNQQYGFSLSFTPSEAHRIRFDYDDSHQKYDNTPTYDIESGSISYPLGTKDNIESIWAERSGQVNPRAGYAADQEFDRQWWSLTYNAEWDFGRSFISLAYVDTQNNGRTMPLSVAERQLLGEMYYATGEYAGMDEATRKALAEETFLPRNKRPLESSQYTLDARLDIPLENLAGYHNLVIGTQITKGELLDGVFGMEDARENGVQEQEMYALFIEDNWTIIDPLTITAGIRYDNHDVFGSNVSPRLYSVYTLSDNWTIKGGVSTGFKTPQTTDLYDGITGFGGQGTSPFAGNPDLTPETSVNSEIALYWSDDENDHNFNITYFNTKFEDKIARGDTVQSCEATNGVRPCVNLGAYDSLGYTTYSQKINIDKVDLQGIEIAGRVAISQDWNASANYTWTDSEQKSGASAGQPLTNTAEHMANITTDWTITEELNAYLQLEIRSDRYRDWNSVLDKPLYYKNYNSVNLGARYKFSENVTVNLRINNLLDEDFTSYATDYVDLDNDGIYVADNDEVIFTDDYNIKDKARSFWVSVKASF